MSAGDDHDVGRLAGRQPRHGLLEILRDDFLRLGKTFAVGVGLAVIHHGDVEAGDSRDLVKACSIRGLRRKYKVPLEVGSAR